jgi:hypothetical protein
VKLGVKTVQFPGSLIEGVKDTTPDVTAIFVAIFQKLDELHSFNETLVDALHASLASEVWLEFAGIEPV